MGSFYLLVPCRIGERRSRSWTRRRTYFAARVTRVLVVSDFDNLSLTDNVVSGR
jgi:hypothetical protein